MRAVKIWPMRPLIEEGRDWASKAAELRTTFLSTTGEAPSLGQRLRGVKRGETVETCHHWRTLLHIEIDADDIMPAWLLTPKEPPLTPRAALALHPTAPEGKDATAIAGKYPYGAELADRGWTVLVPDNFAVKSRYAAAHTLEAYDTKVFYERFPRWSAVGKMIRDGQICLDLMAELPETSDSPVALIGHSLGSQYASYLGAVDERPFAVVTNCGLYPFADNPARGNKFRKEWFIYFCDDELERSVREGPCPLWDIHEVMALAAPRPQLVLCASNDECCPVHGGVTQSVDQLHNLYKHLDAPGHLATILHNHGHGFLPEYRELAYAWLERQVESQVER